MRQQIGQMALIASAALALAACASTTPTPAYPITQPAAPAEPPPPAPAPPPPPPPADNAPKAAPTAPVSSAPLAPPAAAAPESPPPAVTPAPAARPVQEEPPPPAPAYTPPPPPQTTTVLTVTGKVVDAEGKPQIHTVRRGDTVDAIARDFDMSRKELTDANKLKPPYRLKPGMKIKGPATKAKAYVVGSGDTIYSISRRFSVSSAALASANGKRATSAIRPGEKLILPKGYRDTGPVRRVQTIPGAYPAPAPSAPAYTPPAYAPPPPPAYTPPAAAAPTTTTAPPIGAVPARPPAASYPRTPPTTPAAPPIIDTNAPPSDADVVAAGRGKFVTPVMGEIISGFGPKAATGQRSDGIDIRAAAGTPVKAAAAGEVVYAGDQVPEFGNLVLIKHADGWVTAYAHLQHADVKMRQVVTQGQTIGQVGMSGGGVTEPQLHFEVRYAPSPKDKARPIDPQLVLPK